MRDMERLQHKLHAKLPAFQRKLDWTRQIIEDACSKEGEWYLAFSGGIDSTVLLDLLWQGAKMPVLWGDDGWDYPDTLAFLRETETRYGFRLTRIRSMQPWRDWCTEMDRPDLVDDPEALSAWGNPQQWDATWNSLKDAVQYGYGGVFLGLLASESRTRSYALKRGFKALYQVAAEQGMWHCSPLAAWTKQDVWSYAVSRNLAYNTAYGHLAEQDVPVERRRVAPLTCFRTMQYGSVVTLRRGWPDLYNQLATTFPHVRTYA